MSAEVQAGNFSSFIQLCFAIDTTFVFLHVKVCDFIEEILKEKVEELQQEGKRVSPVGSDKVGSICYRAADEVMAEIRADMEKKVRPWIARMAVCAVISAMWLFLVDAVGSLDFWHSAGYWSPLLLLPFLVYVWLCGRFFWSKKQEIKRETASIKEESKKASTTSTGIVVQVSELLPNVKVCRPVSAPARGGSGQTLRKKQGCKSPSASNS